MSMIRTCLSAGVLLVMLSACGQPEPPALPDVVNVFNIGETAYVRSLAVDADQNRLWVGTSIGAMEIDLDSHEMLNAFTRKDGLANEYVFGIGVDSDGYTWFGTNAGGASRYRRRPRGR